MYAWGHVEEGAVKSLSKGYLIIGHGERIVSQILRRGNSGQMNTPIMRCCMEKYTGEQDMLSST